MSAEGAAPRGESHRSSFIVGLPTVEWFDHRGAIRKGDDRSSAPVTGQGDAQEEWATIADLASFRGDESGVMLATAIHAEPVEDGQVVIRSQLQLTP